MSLESTNDGTFDKDIAHGLVLVDFWASWCGPCRVLAPTLESIQEELGARIKIIKLNVEESPSIAAKFNVTSIPLMILFKDGEKVDQWVGNLPKSKILEGLNAHF